MPSPPIDLSVLPQAPGVYRFRDAAGRVMYIGRAVDLRRRVRSYWGSQRGRPRMRRMVPQIVQVEALVCASEHEASWLERNLLEQSKPRWNRARGGLEVPVYLRLDPGPRAPSLSVVHEVAGPFAHYGPYLGGTRVRVAATALASMHPLAYAGEQLTGSALAMAEARGVVAADRPALVSALTALLDRDPDAINEARRSLEERRGDAARQLEFELAARFQTQLEALEWLVSEQRVTQQSDGAPAGTIAGWADGVLVELGHKEGRVRTWKQRPCPREDAARALAATPAEWSQFAQQSAELAARIRAAHAAG